MLLTEVQQLVYPNILYMTVRDLINFDQFHQTYIMKRSKQRICIDQLKTQTV